MLKGQSYARLKANEDGQKLFCCNQVFLLIMTQSL